MNIDTKIMFGRYIVARYGMGSLTVRDIDADLVIVITSDRMPTDEAGFEALFKD